MHVRLSKLCCAALLIAALAVALAAAACGSDEPEPAAAPDPAETLQAVAANIAAMETASIAMVDEMESGAKFFGSTLEDIEAQLHAPDRFSLTANVEAPGFGFLSIDMIKVGDQSVMKFAADSPWAPVPPEQIPFDLAGLGVVFGNLPNTMTNVTSLGMETVAGVETFVVQGVVPSEALLPLMTTAGTGHQVTMTLWVDLATEYAPQVRLAGMIYDDDAPGTSRLVTIWDINQPVEIALPATAP